MKQIDVFLKFSWCNPVNVGNLISSSFSFSKPSLDIWKFLVHIMLKPSMQDSHGSHGYTEVVCIPSSSGLHLSELSAMTCPSWVTLHSMAHSFTELCAPLYNNKAVILEGEAIPNSSFNDAQSCPTRCNPMDCSMPGFPVHHQLLELAQILVYWIDDAVDHLILFCPLLLLPLIFLSIRVFSDESVLPSGGQSIGASASASVLPMNIQDWFPLGLTGLISLQSKGLSRVFSNTTVQKH